MTFSAPRGSYLSIVDLLVTLLRSLVSIVRTREDLMLENIALRHQLMVVQRHAKRPRITGADRALWVTLRWLWPGWHKRLVVVKPATVIAWHRAGFCTYWRWKSRNKGGRPRIDPESRELLRQMWRDNPTWGSPHIQAELAKLGIEVSDSTVRKYRPRTQKPPSQNWRTFLKNHTRATSWLSTSSSCRQSRSSYSMCLSFWFMIA